MGNTPGKSKGHRIGQREMSHDAAVTEVPSSPTGSLSTGVEPFSRGSVVAAPLYSLTG